MHPRERYYINAHGPDENAVSTIIAKAIQLSRTIPNVGRIVFLTNGFNNTQWLEKLFGYDTLKKLKKGTKLPGTSAIGKFESLRTYSPQSNDIVVTFTLRSDDILLVDDDFGISSLLVIPWINEDIEKWTHITNAIHVQTNAAAQSYELPPCEVRQALQDLTHSINISTGLGNPSDDDLAKTYLRTLTHYKYRLDPFEMESYLIKDLNWWKRHCDELLEIVNKINAGKFFQGGDKTGHKYHNDRWKNACEQQ
jgi:hypothetical protein